MSDHLPEFLIPYCQDRRRLSREAIDRLVDWTREFIEGETTLACGAIGMKLEPVTRATTDREREHAAAGLLDFLHCGFRRHALRDQVIDYTTWHAGRKSLSGHEIGYCPVCGRKGVLFPPFRPDGKAVHWGFTRHKVQPFFLGERILESCTWPEPNPRRPTLWTRIWARLAKQIRPE